jgi:hypothetical protein
MSAVRSRVHEYRAAQLQHSPVSNIADNRAADDFLAYCSRSHREQDVEIAELLADGKGLAPPAEWAP